MRNLVRLLTPRGEREGGEAVYIDPDVVTVVHPAGLPGCSTIHYEDQGCVLVLGNPDDVMRALREPARPATPAGGEEERKQ